MDSPQGAPAQHDAADAVAVPDIAYHREMGVTHADFFRILPKAMGQHRYTVVGHTVSGTVAPGTVRIDVGEQQVRRIALMAIPYAKVSFLFRGVPLVQQQAFKKHFDLYFQRGGG